MAFDEPGRATIADFRQQGSQVAFPVEAVEAATVEVVIVGDLEMDELSTNHCGRCHKVDRADKYAGIELAIFSCDASFEGGTLGSQRFTPCPPTKH